jgi:hypothetical protein
MLLPLPIYILDEPSLRIPLSIKTLDFGGVCFIGLSGELTLDFRSSILGEMIFY